MLGGLVGDVHAAHVAVEAVGGRAAALDGHEHRGPQPRQETARKGGALQHVGDRKVDDLRAGGEVAHRLGAVRIRHVGHAVAKLLQRPAYRERARWTVRLYRLAGQDVEAGDDEHLPRVIEQ